MFEKLRLKEGDRLLDVGCGWGGMVRYAARRGVKATGVTLSREQTTWAQQAIADEGLGELAEVRYGDYRDIAETGFDAVSSIGLLEHIGVRNYPSYFRFLQSRMRPGGLLLNHCITRSDNHTEPSAQGFIDRYVFPDGELTGSGRIISEAQDAGLEVLHEENLRPHYAMTLRDWCANLVEHWDEAVAEVGLPAAKVWGLYMAGSRLAFETGGIQLHQVLAVTPGRGRPAAAPLVDAVGRSSQTGPASSASTIADSIASRSAADSSRIVPKVAGSHSSPRAAFAGARTLTSCPTSPSGSIPLSRRAPRTARCDVPISLTSPLALML